MSADAAPVVLAAESIDVRYGDRSVVTDLSLQLTWGTVTALVGPNGSGKSTLLKTLARLLLPASGVVYLDGKAITSMSSAAIAQRLAILPQGPRAPEGLTVRELVEQGRYPHVGALRMLRQQDHAAIREALALTDMERFSHRALDTLSGGERQRAWIALALAQATPLLLLDEPTTFLDIGHQLEVLELIRRLNQERGMTITVVLHDLNHAARYADRLVVLQRGAIVGDGPPATTLTPAILEHVFGVRAHLLPDPDHGVPICVPYAAITRRQDGPPTKETTVGRA